MDAGASRRIGLAAGIAAALCASATILVLAADAARSGVDGEQLRPDLVVERPSELYVAARGREIRLRVSNTVANRGHGPLEITGDGSPCPLPGDTAGRNTVQRLYEDSSNPADSGYFVRAHDDGGYDEQTAGCSRFHPSHNHWHFDNFARYTLIDEDTGEVAGGSRKVSFCVIDTGNPYPGLAGSPGEANDPDGNGPYYPQDPEGKDPSSPTCSETSVDGLSIGWEDTYGASLPGQGIIVSELHKGRYCLVLETDPPTETSDGGVLAESDEGNNVRTIRIALRPRRFFVKRLDPDCHTPV